MASEELSRQDLFNRLRALDGSTVLLRSSSQGNTLCRGKLVEVHHGDEYQFIEMIIDFPELGSVEIPGHFLSVVDNEPSPVFMMTLPTTWLIPPGRAKWFLSLVQLEVVKPGVEITLDQ